MPSHRIDRPTPVLVSSVKKLLIIGFFICILGTISLRVANGSDPQIEILIGNMCTAYQTTSNGSVCMLNPEGKVILWANTPRCDSIRVEENGITAPTIGTAINEGCRVQYVSRSTEQQTVLSVKDSHSGRILWNRKLDRSQPNLLTWTTRIKYRTDDALSEVTSTIRNKSTQIQDAERLMDLSLAAAVNYQRHGQIDLALSAYRQAYEYATRAQFPSISIQASLGLAYVLRFDNHFSEARTVVHAADLLVPEGDAYSRMLLDWLQGNLLEDQEHLTEAAYYYRRVWNVSEMISDKEYRRKSTAALVRALTMLDRNQELMPLLSLYDDFLADSTDCQKAQLQADKAWKGVHIATSMNQYSGTVKVGKENSHDLFHASLAAKQCHTNESLVNIYNGLARVAFLENRLPDAHVWISKSRMITGGFTDDVLEILDLEGRISIFEGQADVALKIFNELERRAKTTEIYSHVFECMALVGIQEALVISGKFDASIEKRVNDCLDPGRSTLVPFYIRTLTQRATSVGFTIIPTASPTMKRPRPPCDLGWNPYQKEGRQLREACYDNEAGP